VKYFVDLTAPGPDSAPARVAVEVDGHTGRLAAAPDAAAGEDATLDPDAEGVVRLLRVGAAIHRVEVRRLGGRGRYALVVGGFRYEVEALDERTRAIRDLVAATAGPSGPAPLVAPMPGLIVRVTVSPGDVVQAGQGLVVMEAMKMENELRTQSGGVVKAVLVAPGAAVEKGARLVELE
jgi:pyruvate carboxylase subunit B